MSRKMSIPRMRGTWPVVVNLRNANCSEVLYVERDGDFLCLALCPHREECKKRPLCLEEKVEEFLVPVPVPEPEYDKTKLRKFRLKKFKTWEEAVACAVQVLQHEQHER